MKKRIAIMIMAVLMGSLILGCSMEEKQPFETLLSYKESYVGDASAVGGIVKELPGSGTFNGMALETGEKPYGITLKYNILADEWENINSQNLMMYNAASLFALVHNVDNITFVLEGDRVTKVHFLRNEIEALINENWAYYYENPSNWERGFITHYT